MKKFISLFICALLSVASYAQYKVGDIYNSNGVIGFVVVVDDSGNHGLVLSLEDSKADWTIDESLNLVTSAFYEDDGAKNMEAIGTYIQENGLTWNHFPVFAWARSLGDGWYIPAKDELEKIWTNLNGGDLKLDKKSKKIWKSHNKAIKRAGGEDFYTRNASTMLNHMLMGMISSTESDEGKIWAIRPDGRKVIMDALPSPNGAIALKEIEKNNKSVTNNVLLEVTYSFSSRAVHKF